VIKVSPRDGEIRFVNMRNLILATLFRLRILVRIRLTILVLASGLSKVHETLDG
jgi:hypothetical protein